MRAARRLLRRALRIFVPALLSAGVLRALVPPVGVGGGAVLDAVAQAFRDAPLLFATALFVLFSLIVQTWIGVSATGESAPSDGRPRPPRRAAHTVRNAALGIVLAAGAAYGVRAWVALPYWVMSQSMLPTFEAGDRVLARTLPSRGARRGDIVFFTNGEAEGPQTLVKRVLGIPGDRIEMRAGDAFINGWRVPTCDVGTYAYALPRGIVSGRLVAEFLGDATYLTVRMAVTHPFAGPYEVKPGELFVVGDNRDASRDSREWNDGHGAGVPLTVVRGLGERFLVGSHRDGRLDLGRLLTPLSARIQLDGVDVHALEQGLDRCMRERPHDTSPPAPGVTSPVSAR